jgi:Ran GTPase-activating protein (RanGAP) involved in mRNA processing and transport
MTALPDPLRLLLDVPPNEITWQRLCNRLEKLPDLEVAEFVPALEEALSGWPDELRLQPFGSWTERWIKGEEVAAWPLLRTLRFTTAVPERVLLGDGIAHITGLQAIWLHGNAAATLRDIAAAKVPLPFKRLMVDSHNEEVPASAVEAALQSPALKSLTHFALEGCRFSDAEARTLAKSPALSRLLGLTLKGGSLKAPGLKALLKSKNLGPLEHLDVNNNSLGKPGGRELGALIAARKLPLRVLRAGANRSSSDEFAAFFATPLPGTLRELEWGFQNVTDGPLTQALSSPTFPLLEVIDFTSGSLTAAGVAALASSPRASSLRSLNVRMNHIGPDGVRALASGTALGRLEILNLEMTDSYPASGQMGPAVVDLIESPGLPSLHTLALGHVPLGEAVVDAIIAAPARMERLVSLGLGWTGQTEASITRLCDALRSGAPRLVKLELPGNIKNPSGDAARAIDALRGAGVEVSV